MANGFGALLSIVLFGLLAASAWMLVPAVASIGSPAGLAAVATPTTAAVYQVMLVAQPTATPAPPPPAAPSLRSTSASRSGS